MRKLFIILITAILVTLMACGKEMTPEETETLVDNLLETQLPIESENTTENRKSDKATEAFDLSDVSPVEALKMVMLNEAPFYYADDGAYSTTEYRCEYLMNVPYNGKPIIITQFTILDLDGDSVPEIVLGIDDYMGSVILRYREGKVFGNIIGYRAMYSIKKDASFWQSNSASEHSISKIFFIENLPFFDEISEQYEYNFELYYYMHDIPVDEKIRNEYMNAREELEDVEWYTFSKEEILARIVENQALENVKYLKNERQNELDSLYYLIEMVYDSNGKSQKEYNEYAKKFYYSCQSEMNSMYELCKGRVTGDELESLEKEQREWQEGIDYRLERELYKSNCAYSVEELEHWGIYQKMGNLVLKRTFHLINRYYGCEFYD